MNRGIRRDALSHIQNDQDPEIQEEIGAKALYVDDEEETLGNNVICAQTLK